MLIKNKNKQNKIKLINSNIIKNKKKNVLNLQKYSNIHIVFQDKYVVKMIGNTHFLLILNLINYQKNIYYSKFLLIEKAFSSEHINNFQILPLELKDIIISFL